MFFNYFKGSSAAVISSVLVFVVLNGIFNPDFNISESLRFSFSVGNIATLFGYIGGLIAIGIIFFDSNKEIFTKMKIIVFTIAGIGIGFGIELITEFRLTPFFIIATLVGSLMFLIVQKIENKIFGWSIIGIHFWLLFVYPLFW